MTQQLPLGALSFKLSLIFIIPLIIPQATSLGSECGGLESEFFSADNRALKNSSYDRKTVPHVVTCGRDCSVDRICQSFNFHYASKLCELNNSTWSDNPAAYIEDRESMYFDRSKCTPLFPLYNVSDVRHRSCKALLEAGYSTSCVYMIYPNGYSNGLRVYCDMDIDGGGWIVFQRREDGSVDFYRAWNEYASGFGDLYGEHWLGNDKLDDLTSDDSHGTWELRVDLTDWAEDKAFAKYTNFTVSGDNYTLDYGDYNDDTSTVGDSLFDHKGLPFSTKDNDNDANEDYNCAQLRTGGWWFNACFNAHLNGYYYPDGEDHNYNGIVWYRMNIDWNPLKSSSMKIRETDV